MKMETAKKFIPQFGKKWIKKYPLIGNVLDKIIHGQREINVFNNIQGMLGADEREYLFVLAKNLSKGSTIVEIGCFAGLSTYFLGKGAQISQSKIYSIDPFVHKVERQIKEGDSSWYLRNIKKKPSLHSVQKTLNTHQLKDVVTLIEGFGQEVAATWNHKKVDLLWIDGNHLEAYDDFKAWERNLSNNALIVFHDSTGPQGIPEVMRDVERIIDETKPLKLTKCHTITAITLNSNSQTHYTQSNQLDDITACTIS